MHHTKSFFFLKILKELKPLTILTETNQPESLLNHSWWYRLKKYLYSFWNVLDVISFILTVAAIFIRFFKPTTTNNLARRVYSLSLFTMYMRFLHVILVQRKLGPKIIMIKEMVRITIWYHSTVPIKTTPKTKKHTLHSRRQLYLLLHLCWNY